MEQNIFNEREVLPATLHSLPIQIPIANNPMIHDEIFPDLICPKMLNTKCYSNDLELNSPMGDGYDIDKYECINEDNKGKENILKSDDQLILENMEVDISIEGSGDSSTDVNLKREVDVENISSHEICFPKIPIIGKDDMLIHTKKSEASTQTKIKDVRSKLEFILTENYDRIGYWPFEEKLQNVCGAKQGDCYKCKLFNQSFNTNIEKNINLNQINTEAVVENCNNITEKKKKKEEAKELITTEQTQNVSTMHSEVNEKISRGDKSKDKESKENNFVLKVKSKKKSCGAGPNKKIKKRLFSRFLNFFTFKRDKVTSPSWPYTAETL